MRGFHDDIYLPLNNNKKKVEKLLPLSNAALKSIPFFFIHISTIFN